MQPIQHDAAIKGHLYNQVVAWGDIDAFGHLNNVNYYRYMESARIAYLQELDIFSSDLYVVIAHSQCQYMQPVLFPDTLQIYSRVEEYRNSSMRMVYDLYSQAQQQLVATGEAVLVWIDNHTQKKIAIPPTVKQKMLDLAVQYDYAITAVTK